jgi:putative hydrolase of HD superfamily
LPGLFSGGNLAACVSQCFLNRQSWITDGSRQENSAEHSWHAALSALVLAPYAAFPVNVDRVIRMLLLHDIVEIDAGDTFLYDDQAAADQAAREQAAADRALWDEFEAGATPDARFAKAVDRVNPVLLNLATQGVGWQRHGIRLEQVLDRNRGIEGPLPAVWAVLRRRLEAAASAGWLLR